MARVLFFNVPMHGHVVPTLDVVTELVERGEEVVYYLTDDFAEAVRATGARFEGYASALKDWRPQQERFSRLLVEECRYVIPQVIERVRNAQPDYIMYEASCLWGCLLADLFPVPTISCRAGLAVNSHFSHVSYLLGATQGNGFSHAPFQVLAETLNDLASLADICTTYNLPHPELTMDALFFHAEDLNIIFASRLVQPEGETFDERFVFVGPSPGSRRGVSASWDVRLPGPAMAPALYISLGTIYNAQPDFYRLCFQAFGNRAYRVITSLGKGNIAAELGPVPENFLLCASVPQLAVLQQVDVFVTHGGLNSVMEALYYGVPMVIIPQMPEQMITARRLADLGLGVVLDKESLTSDALHHAVQNLSGDSGLRARMERAQTEVRASGGAQCAADAVLQFVSQQHLAGTA